MKTLLPLALLLLGMSACTKQSDLLEAVLQKPETPPNLPLTMQQVLHRSVLYPTAGIQVMGLVSIIEQPAGRQLVLDSFSISPGPDLKVYLSKEATPGMHLNLGNLKAHSGTQYYTVPPNTDLSSYGYVLIHCQQYNHLFSYAKLQ